MLAGYCAISYLYFGLPLTSHPGRYLAATPGQRDPEIFIWSFGWWPHAIGSWTNPFFTHAIYAPTGVNLAWTASAPGLALAFTPLTLLAGPTASYNVAVLLMPAIAAWTCFLLCRSLTHSTWASLVGGYLFGFSSYMLGHQSAGHLNLSGVFLIPLVALSLVRYLRWEIGGRGLAWRLGVIVACQISISSEITLTMAIALGLAVVLAYALMPGVRARLLSSLAPVVGGYALGGVLAAPFVYYTLEGLIARRFADPPFFSGDLLNLVVPTRLVAIGGSSLAAVAAHFPGNDNERGSYLGLPVLLIVALFAVRTHRSPGTRFLLASLATTIVLTIGTALHLDGHRIIVFPWAVTAGWPAFNNVLPERFAVYASLAAAVIVASWATSARRRRLGSRYLLPALAVVSLVPAVWQVTFHELPERWPFFTQGLFTSCIPRNETLAIFPFGRWGDAMLWQAESGFWFRMAEGNMGPDNLPENFYADPTLAEIEFQFIDPSIRPSMTQLLAYVKSHRVDRIVSVVVHAYPDGTQMHAFGSLQGLGGVLVSPGCGYTSLAGDPRLVTPGQHDLAGKAALTVVLESRRSLERAATLLGPPNRVPAALRLLEGSSAALQLVQSYDRTAVTLQSALALIGRARSTLAVRVTGSARQKADRRAEEWIRNGAAALSDYVAVINPGVPR